MKATEFGRYGCIVGERTITYATLRREWRCNECAGGIVLKFADDWYAECGRCGACDFIHEAQAARERHEALEVLDGLPPELAAQLIGGE